MTKLEDYRKALSTMGEWRPYLLKNSGLPGPRGNLELAQAVAELVSRDQAEAFLSIPAERAPENSPEVFLVFCGITALGKMAARRDADALARLRAFASDERWRVREAVAIALQYFGDADMQALLHEMEFWSRGNWYEKRAAAAALAEPRLLKDKAAAVKVLYIINRITEDLAAGSDPREDSYKVLRQTLVLEEGHVTRLEGCSKRALPTLVWVPSICCARRSTLICEPGERAARPKA